MSRRAGHPRWRVGLKGVGLALLLAGCGDAAEPYRGVLRDQAAAYEDLERVLGGVVDEATMKSAQIELAKSWKHYEAIKERALALAPPSFSIQEQMELEKRRLNQAFENWQKQVRRIKALPGGDAFLKGLAMDP